MEPSQPNSFDVYLNATAHSAIGTASFIGPKQYIRPVETTLRRFGFVTGFPHKNLQFDLLTPKQRKEIDKRLESGQTSNDNDAIQDMLDVTDDCFEAWKTKVVDTLRTVGGVSSVSIFRKTDKGDMVRILSKSQEVALKRRSTDVSFKYLTRVQLFFSS